MNDYSKWEDIAFSDDDADQHEILDFGPTDLAEVFSIDELHTNSDDKSAADSDGKDRRKAAQEKFSAELLCERLSLLKRVQALVNALPKSTPLRQQATTLLGDLEDLQSCETDLELREVLDSVQDNMPNIERLAAQHYGAKSMCKSNLASPRDKAEGVYEMPAGLLNESECIDKVR